VWQTVLLDGGVLNRRGTFRGRARSHRSDDDEEIVGDFATPDTDAKEYIGDVINVCLRDAAFGPEEEEDPEYQQPEWEVIAENLMENPEQLVEMGEMTPEQLEECGGEPDDELVAEVAFRIYEQNLAEDLKTRDGWEGGDPAEVSEEDSDGFDHFESSALVRELLLEASVALMAGDADSIVQVLDALFDEVGQEPDNIGNLENWASFLSQSTITANRDERQIDEIAQLVADSVQQLAERLCELIAKDGIALRFVEWRHLETVIATALAGIGFSVELTPPSKDGGKDVVATCALLGKKHVFFIEIKHWRSGKRVNAVPVMEFVEININSSSGGLFLSTSGFGQDVFTHLTELERANVHLGGANKVVSLCQHYIRSGRGLWTTRQPLPQILFDGTMKNSADSRLDRRSSL